MTLSIECKRCGHVYDISPEDIASGTWQRRGCPVCNPPRTEEPS